MPVKVTLNNFAFANKQIEQVRDQIVRQVALEAQRESQLQVRALGAIDTGALFNSAYTETSADGSDRPKAISAATAAGRTIGKKSKRRRTQDVAFAMVSGKLKEGQARIAFSVDYALVVHQGNKKGMVGRPYLSNGLNAVKPRVLSISKRVAARYLGA
jgi:hypothetical protein